MTVKIETAASKETAVVDAEAQAAAEMAAKAQQSQGEEVKPVAPNAEAGDNPDDNTDDWAEFLVDDENEVIPEAVKAELKEELEVIPEEVVVPAEAAETPLVEEVPAVLEEEVAAAEETPEVVVPPVVVEEALPETRTPEEVTAAIAEARSNAHKNLVTQYTMTEDQVDEFRESPDAILANLAADMYLDTYDSIMAAVQQQVPQMIQQITTQNTQRQAADQEFFGSWPQLAKAEFRPTIDRIAQSYRALNPKTSNEDAIKEIGAQAWVALRLPLDQLIAHTSGKPQAVKTPVAAPAVRTPANPGAASQSQRAVPAVELNEYEILAEEFLEDDLN